MKNSTREVLAGLMLVLTSGCGTIYQHQNGNSVPYSGVRFDAAAIAHIHEPATLAFVLDLPLSAIADTLLLPYDIIHTRNE